MKIMGYDVTIEIDGVESLVQLDDTYPSVNDWVSATEFAMLLAGELHPDAEQIEFLTCGEYEMEEYASYGYIHDAPLAIM
jgi:hypothetical protein